MGFPVLTDNQETILTTLGGGILGWIGSWILEWYKKRKNPRDVSDQKFKDLSEIANDNAVTSKQVVDMLDERLKTEKIYYNELIERSKKDCESKIDGMKKDYDEKMDDLRTENVTLSLQVELLTQEKNTLQREVVELKEQLNRYETSNNGTTMVATTTTISKSE